MDDPYNTKLLPGDKGAVTAVDSISTIHVAWDNGSSLGIAYGADRARKIDAEIKYETGADFWRDTAVRHGIDEALVICGNYFSTQLKREQPKEEHQFCRELFAAMYADTAGRTDPAKLVYPYDFQKADERVEASYYHASRKRNDECARAIDEAIKESCYKVNFYNLDIAVMKVIHEYGFPRVNLVLAHQLQQSDWDGRYSESNKKWVQGYTMPEKAFGRAHLNAHPILIEDFANHARKFYDEMGAERFALPGRTEHGTAVQDYEIVRSIAFDDQRGFALGLNPYAPANFVAWQFTTENGKREFYWGHYSDTVTGAAENYTARVLVHMSGGDVKELQNPLAAAEMSSEQNYNMIDGALNNEKSRLDLTDGQTYEEVRELAPETLPEDKPSVMEQIREARKNPQPHTSSKARDKGTPELEL